MPGEGKTVSACQPGRHAGPVGKDGAHRRRRPEAAAPAPDLQGQEHVRADDLPDRFRPSQGRDQIDGDPQSLPGQRRARPAQSGRAPGLGQDGPLHQDDERGVGLRHLRPAAHARDQRRARAGGQGRRHGPRRPRRQDLARGAEEGAGEAGPAQGADDRASSSTTSPCRRTGRIIKDYYHRYHSA